MNESDPAQPPLVDVRREGAVLTLTLRREGAANAPGPAPVEALPAALVGPQAALDLTALDLKGRCRRVAAEEPLAMSLATGIAPPGAWKEPATGCAAEIAAGGSTPEAQSALRRATLAAEVRDSDLADLVRSAALPRPGDRILAHAAAARPVSSARAGAAAR